MKKSTCFFILCLAFVLGVGLHAFVFPDKRIIQLETWYFLFLGFILGVVLLWAAHVQGRIIIIGLTSAFLCLGFFRFALAVPEINKTNIAYYVGKEISLHGKILSLPRKYEKVTSHTVSVEEIENNKQWLALKNSKILLTVSSFPAYEYGDEIVFNCAPEDLAVASKYAFKDGIKMSCAFPKHISLLKRGQGSPIKHFLFSVRAVFDERLKGLFPDPYGALLAGILYGDTTGFSKEIKSDFRIAGISHITALSGYNVTILAQLLISGLVFVWFTRKQSLPIAFLLILAFVILTGAEASVVRAAVMGFLILGAKGIGRLSKMHVAFALAGAVMLAINPYLLRFDLGFQLSFLAAIALVWLASDLGEYTWLRWLPNFLELRQAASASSAAILFTAPLLFYTTGAIGPFSLITNILVVPIIPFVMGLGFGAVVADFILHPIALVVSWVTRVILGYILGVAQYFAKFGAINLQFSAPTAVTIFVIIVAGVWWWKKRLATMPQNKVLYNYGRS